MRRTFCFLATFLLLIHAQGQKHAHRNILEISLGFKKTTIKDPLYSFHQFDATRPVIELGYQRLQKNGFHKIEFGFQSPELTTVGTETLIKTVSGRLNYTYFHDFGFINSDKYQLFLGLGTRSFGLYKNYIYSRKPFEAETGDFLQSLSLEAQFRRAFSNSDILQWNTRYTPFAMVVTREQNPNQGLDTSFEPYFLDKSDFGMTLEYVFKPQRAFSISFKVGFDYYDLDLGEVVQGLFQDYSLKLYFRL